MWKSCFVFIFFLGSVWCAEDAVVTNDAAEHKFSQEEDCSRAGGMCLPRADCPADKISETGNCPEQSSSGAVCCHSVPITETRCQQLGGACRESCPQRITLARANDCPEGEKCCALVF